SMGGVVFRTVDGLHREAAKSLCAVDTALLDSCGKHRNEGVLGVCGIQQQSPTQYDDNTLNDNRY
ncbi:hypothetical protein, partial [Rhizobium leguminosarum]|uniref:hypothetical protein n=1 Tax=Rhizobium leguminosarum TaxID=384 RepID=UPI003F98EAD1